MSPSSSEGLGVGRCCMAVLADASPASLKRFITENVEEGSTLVTDASPSYPPAGGDCYVHNPIKIKRSGESPHIVLPGRFSHHALGGWYASRLGQRPASPELPQRVRLPLRPSALRESRTGLLPRA